MATSTERTGWENDRMKGYGTIHQQDEAVNKTNRSEKPRSWTVGIMETGAPCCPGSAEFQMLEKQAKRLGVEPSHCCLYCSGWAYVKQRAIIRERYNIQGSRCDDYCVWRNCFSFGVHQMDKELDAMGV